MNSPDDVNKQVEQKLSELSQGGIISSIGIAYADGRPTVFVAVSAQTDELAPDYDKTYLDEIRLRIGTALGGIPFQILGDYSEISQGTLAPTSDEYATAVGPEGTGQAQPTKLQAGSSADRNDDLLDLDVKQHAPKSNTLHEDIVSDDVREKLNDVTTRVNVLERATGIFSLHFRAAQNDLREAQHLSRRIDHLENELSRRIAYIEKEMPRLASKRFVIAEGYIIIIVATILIMMKDEIQELAFILFSFIRNTIGA